MLSLPALTELLGRRPFWWRRSVPAKAVQLAGLDRHPACWRWLATECRIADYGAVAARPPVDLDDHSVRVDG